MNIRDLKIVHAVDVFVGWWFSELKTLVPSAVKDWFSDDSARVVLQVGEQSVQVILVCGDVTEVLGEYSLDEEVGTDFLALAELIEQRVPKHATVEIELPEAHLLRHQVQLPLAVEPTLSNVLRFEMDRLTPFTIEQIGYTWKIIERITERDKLIVELIVVRRDYLTKLLARVAQLGLNATAVYPTSASGVDDDKPAVRKRVEQLVGSLLPANLLADTESLWSRRNKQLLLATCLLLSAAIIYPISMQSALIEQLETDIQLISEAAKIAGDKRRLLGAYLDGYELVVNKKNNIPAKIEIIKKLTEHLPDNTWVSRLVIDDESVLLKGESLKSSGLIETLDHIEIFENVEFVSPVVRNSSTNLDRYEIRLLLTGENK